MGLANISKDGEEGWVGAEATTTQFRGWVADVGWLGWWMANFWLQKTTSVKKNQAISTSWWIMQHTENMFKTSPISKQTPEHAVCFQDSYAAENNDESIIKIGNLLVQRFHSKCSCFSILGWAFRIPCWHQGFSISGLELPKSQQIKSYWAM